MEACMDPTTLDECRTPIAADQSETAAVVRLRDFMADKPAGVRRHASLQSPDGTQFEIPTAIYKVLVAAVAAMAQGNAVSIVPVHHELTTQQAADLLGVSRPHLVKLLDSGEIPHHKTGSHRRVYFEDLMRYRDVRDAERREALAALTRRSAELGLDY
ncbi:MAG TPA: helix-turn-helix domain-containing protein [Thermoleophilia bacterium]|nr:helix-turn-helix domain-containing protein [Thermoleophilia bacterium]